MIKNVRINVLEIKEYKAECILNMNKKYPIFQEI